MDRIAGDITKDLVEKLPGGQPLYSLEALSELGFPYVIVEQLKAGLIQKALQNLKAPENEWINSEHPAYADAWQRFQNSVPVFIALPAEYAESVIRNAVMGCLSMAVKPRTSIPAFIFDDNLELDAQTIHQRASRVLINQHLALSLYRYMEKKAKKTIGYEDAEKIIEKIDQKLAENYNPLNWVELLKPLFSVAGPAVPSGLLSIFFEEKGKANVARKFEHYAGSVNETEFIEMMSSAEFLDFENYEKEQTLFDVPAEQKEPGPDETGDEKSADLPVDETEEFIETGAEDEESELNKQYGEPDNEPDDEDFIPVLSGADERSDEDDKTDEPAAVEEESEETDDDVADLNKSYSEDDEEKEDVADDAQISDADEQEEPVDLNELYGEPEEEPLTEDDAPVSFGAVEEETTGNSAEPEKEPEYEDDNSLIEIPHEEDETGDISASPYRPDSEMEREEIELNSLFRIPGEEPEDTEEEGEPGPVGFSFGAEEAEEDAVVSDEETEEPADSKMDENVDEDEEVQDQDLPEIISEPDEPGEETLLGRFMFDDSVDDELPTESEKKEPSTIYDELNLVKEDSKPGTVKSLFDTPDDEPEERVWDETESDEEIPSEEPDFYQEPVQGQQEELPEIEEPDDELDDDLPMWRSFLDRSDVEDDSGFAFEGEPEPESGDEEPEGDFIEEPIFDFTKEEPAVADVIANLSGWMDDDRDRFVDEIFAGSDTAYELALADIMDYENWRQASRYIEREIFARNRIDLYSEVAVDFTDRLHTYFIEYKS